jgi:hypothetical protein
MRMLCALPFPALVKLPDANFPWLLFSKQNHSSRPIPGSWSVERFRESGLSLVTIGRTNRLEYSADEQPGQDDLS